MLVEERSPWHPPEPTPTYRRAWKHWFALVKERHLNGFVTAREWRELLQADGIRSRSTVHAHTKALEDAGLASTVYGGFFLHMGYCNGITDEGLHVHGPDETGHLLPPAVCEDYVDDDQWKDHWRAKTMDEILGEMREKHDSIPRRDRAADALNGAMGFCGGSEPGKRLRFEDFRIHLAVHDINSAVDDDAAEYEGYPSSVERARELAELACEMGWARIHEDLTIELLKPPRATKDAPEPVPTKRRGSRNRSDRARLLA